MAGKRRNMTMSQELRAAADDIIALEIEKKEIADDIKARYEALEAKGFDVSAVKIAVKRRKESATQRAARRERDAIADVYSAAMGDLFGKALDDLTRQRMEEERQRLEDRARGDKKGESDDAAAPEQPSEPLPGTTGDQITPQMIDAAREEGRQARRADPPARIVDNPYHSSDPRRAAWDEGWCEADGSDGMEVPEAWRRKKDEKPADDAKGGEGGEPPPPAGETPDDPNKKKPGEE